MSLGFKMQLPFSSVFKDWTLTTN